jgi:hypothetical protein
VESVKSWLDNFYRIPPSTFMGLPFHFWSQMIMCVTVLKYLSVLEDPAWDCQAVRNTVDLLVTIDRIVQRLDLGCKEPSLQCDDNLIRLLSKLLSKCRVWASARLNVAPYIPGAEARSWRGGDPCSTTSRNSNIPDLDQMVWMQTMDLENDQWFEEAMGWNGGTF